MIKVTRSYSSECSISGALGLVLRMSQLVGIGPLAFKKRGQGWNVRLSPTLCSASFVAATVMNIAALTGLLLDLQAVPSHSVRVRSPTRKYVWISDYTIVLLTASVAAYGAPRRLRETISCLSRMQKMNVAANSTSPNVMKTSTGVIVFCVFAISLFTTDYCVLVKDVLISNREFRVACLYSSYYYAYVLLFLFELQFVLSALEVVKAMGAICNTIIDLSHNLNVNHVSYNKIISNYPTKKVSTQSLNLMIDSMASNNLGSAKFIVGSPPQLGSETILRLATTYLQVCQMVRQMDSCHGPGLLLLLFSLLLHLVIAPYNLIVHITSSSKGLDLTAGLQMLWCAFHFACTILIAEPSYRMQLEVERTNLAIDCMLIKSTDGVVCKELQKFSTYLSLNAVSFSPLGVCMLTRSLVVSIIGSVATYLVIIIQFQLSEQ